MSDAPERVGEGTVSESYESHAARAIISGTEYIRADHAQAKQEADGLANDILARADTDALEAVRAEARAEALREAAWVARMTRAPIQDTQHEAVGLPPIGDQIAKAIRALIPADQDGDG